MKRSADQAHTGDRNKKSQANASAPLTLQQLSQRTNLSIFMLQTLGDMHDPKSGKYSGQPQLIDFAHNYELPSLAPATLERYRARTPAAAKLNNDETILHMLREQERELARATVAIAGADDQGEKMPARERDAAMVNQFCSYAHTFGNYFVYTYYVGPEFGGDRELGRQLQSQEANWQLVPKHHLCYFHRRIKKVQEYQQHSKNNQVVISEKSGRPLYDPRYIVVRWRKAKENEAAVKLVTANLHLLLRPEDPALAELRQRGAAKKLCVEQDRAEQRKRGFLLHDHPRFSRISMEEFPELYRVPITKQITFSLEDLVYLAQRLRTSDEWDPLVLVRALTIALNCDAHIKRLLSQVCDQQQLILERDDVSPIVERLTSDPEAIAQIKASVMQYLYALLAVDLVTREKLPTDIEAKMKVAGPHDLNMLEV